MMIGCLQCINTSCTLCQPQFKVVNGLCECVIGSQIGQQCITVLGCTNIYYDNNGIQICLQCDTSMFNQLPVNGRCECIRGELAGEVCCQIQNCVSAVMLVNGSIICEFCNVIGHFKTFAQNNVCVCEDKYEYVNNRCSDICGDGYLMQQYGTVCDDGNLIDGDGCSSSCLV